MMTSIAQSIISRVIHATLAVKSRRAFRLTCRSVPDPKTSFFIAVLTLALALAWPGAAQDLPTPQPSPLIGLAYKEPFFPEASYDANVPTPDSLLGFPVGTRPATHAQIETVFKSLGAKSPRCKLVEYGKTHEGRSLYYLVIASAANLNRLVSPVP